MLFTGTLPEHGAEAARIGVAQGHARIQLDIHMLMLEYRSAHRHQPQVAGHAQMTDQGAATDIHQQILGPTADRGKGLVLDLDRQILGDRPAQARITHYQPDHLAALQVGRNATAGGFYFG